MQTANLMQEYGSGSSNKSGEYCDCSGGKDCSLESSNTQHQRPVTQKCYGGDDKNLISQNFGNYSNITTGSSESLIKPQYQTIRYNNSSAPTFCSPPNSPLVGLVFDSSSLNFSSPIMTDRFNVERRSQSSWSITPQEPIGTGAKKKIVKSQDKRNAYSADPRCQERYKDTSTETDRPRNQDQVLTAESTSSLDFFAEGEKMVSELCNITDFNARNDTFYNKSQKFNQTDDKNRHGGSAEILMTALDKIVIHDQIPNQIVQLAIEACTDAENIAIAHHNRPCFKNIHSICAKTRSNVQKPDSAVANLHSQGIPWVIKNFIFSFVRILDGWKGVKELLSEKHDTFSRIENKYYSQNIRECFVQWQAVTKEMLTHIYKTFKCLDHGFTMEQKSFTHNYYATNSPAPRHQNQSKFQPIKQHINTPRPINTLPHTYNVMQPPWIQAQTTPLPQSFLENQWSNRSAVSYKKNTVAPSSNSQNMYSLNDQIDTESVQKSQYKCDPCSIRETKPRQSWTITNVPDLRSLEGLCHTDQRELYTQLKHRMDAELGKAPGQPILNNTSYELLQRRDIEVKPKMIPLSHVEKTLIPNLSTPGDVRTCFVQRNNSCGDTKEDVDFFATWGQIAQKTPSDYLTHQPHNLQIPPNVVTISNNISGPVQFIEPENDEFHEMSKVYMKPGSYKVPIKPTDPLSSLLHNTSQDISFNATADDSTMKLKSSLTQITLAPQPKYNIESWPCLLSKRVDETFLDKEKVNPPIFPTSCLDIRTVESLDILNSMVSDQAWEAAKQSAPKLLDFIHDGSKSDTTRLYDALGLNSNEELLNDYQQLTTIDRSDTCCQDIDTISSNQIINNSTWDQAPPSQCKENDIVILNDDEPNAIPIDENKSIDFDDQGVTETSKSEESKSTRRRNYDQAGIYIKDDNPRKSSKSKVAASGMWYHPKKKKPLANTIVKKFENIITVLSQLNEAAFIRDDMDIKVAPRFYEVVKYPMCLSDISTKLKNSSYTDYDQVIQDFKRIFSNVRLYLKNYQDPIMKKNLSKVSSEFEKILNDEFPHKLDTKSKSYENPDSKEVNSKRSEKDNSAPKIKTKGDVQNDSKSNENDK